MLSVLSKPFDKLGRYSPHNCIRLHILCHHRPGADDGILTDRHSGQDSRTGTYPAVPLQHNRFASEDLMLLRRVVV